MVSRERTKYWMELVYYDLETAEAMLETERFLYVGYMCHQSVEKALKAYHWKEHQTEPPFVHNLSRLSENAGILKSLDRKQLELVNVLNPLNIEARYPRDREKLLEKLDYEYCRSIIDQTKELIKWIEKKL
ncbi:MAG: HEPN domain-containing protein [Spirochaetota bacterium]|nr:HEPN domain-containing protein [Spirochaetota bacterium]